MYPVQFQNREEVAELITSLAKFNILDDWVMKNPAVWATSSLFYHLVSVPGIVIMDGIIPNREANVHIFLFEKPGDRCKALIVELRKEIKKYFRMFGLKRMAGYIPEYNKKSRRFAVALGFRYEGTKRKATVVNGVYSDLCCYSIIDSDMEENNGGKLAKHIGSDRKRDADGRPNDTGRAVGEGLHDPTPRTVGEKDDRGPEVAGTPNEVRGPALLRFLRAAKRYASSINAAVWRKRKPVCDEPRDWELPR